MVTVSTTYAEICRSKLKQINSKKYIIYRTVHVLVLTEFVIQFAMHRMNSTRFLVWFKYCPFVLHTEYRVLTLYEYYTRWKHIIKHNKKLRPACWGMISTQHHSVQHETVCWETGDHNSMLTAITRTAGKYKNFIWTIISYTFWAPNTRNVCFKIDCDDHRNL